MGIWGVLLRGSDGQAGLLQSHGWSFRGFWYDVGVNGKGPFERTEMKSILAAVVVLMAALFVSFTPARAGESTTPVYDVPPEAMVRINGRSYGMYISLQRVIPGIMPEGGLPAPDVDVNITLFTLDGSPVPGNLPEMRVVFEKRSPAWFRRGSVERWSPTVSLVPVNTLVPATSVTYFGEGEPGESWNNAAISAKIQFVQRGRVAANAKANNLRITTLALP